MANAADIIVNLVAKTGSLERGMKRGGKSVSNFQRRAAALRKTVVRVGAALGALAIVKVASLVAKTGGEEPADGAVAPWPAKPFTLLATVAT